MIEQITSENWPSLCSEIMEIQLQSYEPGRRDSESFLKNIVESDRSVCLVALSSGKVAGYTFAGALELFEQVNGVRDDENFGELNTLYGADVTVSSKFRNQGVGRLLKQRQVELARDSGYRYVSGRNRVGLADAMWRLNQSLGAVEVCRIHNDYPDGPPPRDAIYYRIPL